LGVITAVFGFLIGLFPKTLPRAAVRRAIAIEKNKGNKIEVESEDASMAGKMSRFLSDSRYKESRFHNNIDILLSRYVKNSKETHEKQNLCSQ